jgi:hypothetical protein
MTVDPGTVEPSFHQHGFLGEGHAQSERKTWTVIWLCGAMMCAEIVGGLLFGSIALVANGLHMSTHSGALLLAALAYTYARPHAGNTNFTFGTGKFGDLAGFTSAIVLAMIAILIGYRRASAYEPTGAAPKATRSPACRSVTPAPTSSTTPAPSPPRPLGNGRGYRPVR